MSVTRAKLPELREISLLQVPNYETLPKPRIKTDHDLDTWRKTRSYQDYSLFLRRLNEAVVGQYLPWNATSPSQVPDLSCCL
jgi:serine/threonine-protein phosphatase 2A activator